ncbi:hypothetical protein N431DRAFT_439547 [Stipitochalara longipes BDJ]|nr:hypothetical protein N431DRAFT_439547 [Stipitochalara longipes BDJ]
MARTLDTPKSRYDDAKSTCDAKKKRSSATDATISGELDLSYIDMRTEGLPTQMGISNSDRREQHKIL